MSFSIKPGYTENPVPAYFVDDPTSTRGIVFQPDVYTLAEFLAELNAWSQVLPLVEPDVSGFTRPAPEIVDVGCGWGDKLAMIHDRHSTWLLTGIDYDLNLAHCRDTYEWGNWVELDLETVEKIPAADSVVVCSDVIEHLKDPTALLEALKGSGAATIVISTPERDVEHGYDHVGPSPNPCHVREWNAVELHELLESSGFTIIHQGLTRGSDQGWAMGTQLVVMQP